MAKSTGKKLTMAKRGGYAPGKSTESKGEKTTITDYIDSLLELHKLQGVLLSKLARQLR